MGKPLRSRKDMKQDANNGRSANLLGTEAWLAAIDKRTARVGIIGMGYVGLPLMHILQLRLPLPRLRH